MRQNGVTSAENDPVFRTEKFKIGKKPKTLDEQEHRKGAFLAAVRKFMEMDALTAPLLHELIDHIDVYETEGTGKNRTQRIVIYYRFVGYIELPDTAFRRSDNYRADTRQGVTVEYIPA